MSQYGRMITRIRELMKGQKGALFELQQTEAQLRAAYTALQEKRAELFEALEPVDVIVERMWQHVRAAHLEREPAVRAQVADAFSAHYVDGVRDEHHPTAAKVTGPTWPTFLLQSHGQGGTPLLLDLALLFPEQLGARLEAWIRASAHTSPGPAEERAALVADVDREIAAIEDAHTDLCDQAAALGITIPLLEPVANRRRVAALRDEERQRIAVAMAAPPAGRV